MTVHGRGRERLPRDHTLVALPRVRHHQPIDHNGGTLVTGDVPALLHAIGEVRRIAAESDALRDDLLELEGDTDELSGPVAAYLEDAEARLTRATYDIGVFGQVKRGKSTLVNALLGAQVSSTGLAPETAVPVIVTGEPGPCRVTVQDGSVEEYPDPAEVVPLCGQRERRKRAKQGRQIVRIEQHVRSWLPDGVRLVDTPGLSDPSLAVEMRERTLAEMDRVAAAVLVVVSPPGVDSEDQALLREVATRPVDKLFVVVNHHSAEWADRDHRAKIADYVTELLCADGDVHPDDLRIHEVNAREAWQAAEEAGAVPEGDPGGIGSLRSALLDFLLNGAMLRQQETATIRVRAAARLVDDRLARRISMLRDPSILTEVTAAADQRLTDLLRAYEQVASDAGKAVRALEPRLVGMAQEPFDEAIGTISADVLRSSLAHGEARFALRHETVLSQVTDHLHTQLTVIRHEAQLRLDRLAQDGEDILPAPDPSSVRLHSVGVDTTVGPVDDTDAKANALLVGTVTGVATGVVAGSIAGGAGLALLALGPAGWIAGAAMGLLMGGLVGGSMAYKAGTSRLGTSAAAELRDRFAAGKVRASRDIASLLERQADELSASIMTVGRGQARSIRREIDAINALHARAGEGGDLIAACEELQRRLADATP